MHPPNARLVLRALVPVIFVATAAGGCTVPRAEGSDRPTAAAPAPAVVVRAPAERTQVLGSSDPAELALTASQVFFERAEVVVLAAAEDAVARPALTAAAVALHAPALLVGGGTSEQGLTAELDRLGATAAVVVAEDPDPVDVERADGTTADTDVDLHGPAAAAAAAGLEMVRLDPDAVSPDSGELEADDLAALEEAVPGAQEPRLLTEVLALTDPQPGQEAAIATAQAAGAVPYAVPGGDPGAVPDAVRMLDDAQALNVVGIGPAFGDPATFAWRVTAAEGGAVLPTGTQRLFPARYVTTTGDRRDDPEDVVAQAARDAEPYRPGDAPLVPTVVVTASTVSGSAGADGDYVREEPLERLEPLVEAAHAAGQYVLLDVAAGRGPLLDEVRALEPLLRRPGVGVAVHPEQRRAGRGAPQAGAVDVAEIQDVVDYLAGVVTDAALPQTMLVVHQTDDRSVLRRSALTPAAQVAVVVQADRTDGATTSPRVWKRVSSGDLPHLGWAGPRTVPDDAAERLPSDPAPVLVAAS